MTLLYFDPLFLEHETGRHPECPGRLQPRLVDFVDAVKDDPAVVRPDWSPISLAQLARVHDLDYAAMVEKFANEGGGQIETDTMVSPASYQVALTAAGAASDAVKRVIAGEDKTAFCIVRPPGHHALADQPMGFCLFNNVAIAATVARDEFGLGRILIVDWDVHHGNGTQDAFWEVGEIGFLSIHRYPFYPGTGPADATGSGDGLGATLNLPLEFGTTPTEFHVAFTRGLETIAAKLQPELIILSAGFDAHRLDPVGNLGLEAEDYAQLTETVNAVADTYCQGKIVSVLEGGYNPAALAECVAIHFQSLQRAE